MLSGIIIAAPEIINKPSPLGNDLFPFRAKKLHD